MSGRLITRLMPCLFLLSGGLYAANGLKDFPVPSKIFLGAAVSASAISDTTQPLYSSILANEYSIITPGNDMKWAATEPTQNVFKFSAGDTVASFAAQHNMHVRGHNLLWAAHNPAWLVNGQFTATQLKSILINHITTVMSHYRTQFPGTVIYWDVINEIINSGPGVWAPLGGSSGNKVTVAFNIASIALNAARAADPSAKLCLNEYNIEVNAATTPTYQLVSQLKSAGIPLDCVGLQGHLGSRKISKAQWMASLSAFAKLGVEVQITEYDAPTAPPAQYANVLSACLAVPQCTAFVTWGFTDKYTWLGTSAHPLPFDENYQKKPAYFALSSVLGAAAGSATTVNVIAGGPADYDSTGTLWLPDTGFSGGTINTTTHAVTGTPDPVLYQSERQGNFTYDFTVPNGNYTVLLKFAEIDLSQSGQRVFNTVLNGTTVLKNFDIIAAAGAPFQAIDKFFPVSVSNNQITLQFQPVIGNAKISAIGITSATPTQTGTFQIVPNIGSSPECASASDTLYLDNATTGPAFTVSKGISQSVAAGNHKVALLSGSSGIPAGAGASGTCTSLLGSSAITVPSGGTASVSAVYKYTAVAPPPPPVNSCSIKASCSTWGTPGQSSAGSSCNFYINTKTALKIPTTLTLTANGLTAITNAWNATTTLDKGIVTMTLTNPVYIQSVGFNANGIIALPTEATLAVNGQTYTCAVLH